MATAQLFRALGDPVRLHMVERLSDGSIQTIGSLTKDIAISRQGARKQVQVLASAGLIELKPIGREVQVTLNMSELEKGRAFIIKLEAEWNRRLQKLKEISEKL
ncbi:MAG: hypothetical protein RLZZ76_289 [Candidatus Parcubacteria bacterium]|jgi:DNA-binding transcriptional ArsR family regulator